MVEHLATMVCQTFDIEPKHLIWIEHYPERGEWEEYAESFDLVSFNLNAIDENRSATLLKPERSQRVKNHSPDGFNWGYAASGPAQLAKQEIHNCESSFSNFSI